MNGTVVYRSHEFQSQGHPLWEFESQNLGICPLFYCRRLSRFQVEHEMRDCSYTGYHSSWLMQVRLSKPRSPVNHIDKKHQSRRPSSITFTYNVSQLYINYLKSVCPSKIVSFRGQFCIKFYFKIFLLDFLTFRFTERKLNIFCHDGSITTIITWMGYNCFVTTQKYTTNISAVKLNDSILQENYLNFKLLGIIKIGILINSST